MVPFVFYFKVTVLLDNLKILLCFTLIQIVYDSDLIKPKMFVFATTALATKGKSTFKCLRKCFAELKRKYLL